jgi:hypothetical protein
MPRLAFGSPYIDGNAKALEHADSQLRQWLFNLGQLVLRKEWGKWSNNHISKQCGVSQPFASGLRKSLITVISEKRTYKDKHGNVSTMDTSGTLRPPISCPKGAPRRTLWFAPLPMRVFVLTMPQMRVTL